jgi:hypothetical protein
VLTQRFTHCLGHALALAREPTSSYPVEGVPFSRGFSVKGREEAVSLLLKEIMDGVGELLRTEGLDEALKAGLYFARCIVSAGGWAAVAARECCALRAGALDKGWDQA